MLFTFGVEDTYNVPVEPTHVLDVTMEQILLNLNYQNIVPFNRVYSTQRVPLNREVVGRADFELTFGNEAWGRIFEVALGKRVRLVNRGFRLHQNGLHVLVGRLGAPMTKVVEGFSITEPYMGAFDGTNCLLIGDEVINGAVVSNGVVSSSSRGVLGTDAKTHNADDLVYLLDDSANSVDICGPNVVDGRARLTKSLTSWIKRPNSYFQYSGMRMDQMEINLSPSDIPVMSISFVGADSTNMSPSIPIETYDEGGLVSKIYAMSLLEELDLIRLYLNFNNTLVKGTHGLDGIYGDLPLQFQNAYGQITWLWSTMDNYLAYVNNQKHNLTLHFIDWSKSQPDNIIIFNCNDMRVNTFSPQYTGGLVIQDTAPIYTYGENQIYLQY